jgi:hypothetical protein
MHTILFYDVVIVRRQTRRIARPPGLLRQAYNRETSFSPVHSPIPSTERCWSSAGRLLKPPRRCKTDRMSTTAGEQVAVRTWSTVVGTARHRRGHADDTILDRAIGENGAIRLGRSVK